MEKVTDKQIESMRARLKDRSWVIVPDFMPRNAQHLGRMYTGAKKIGVAPIIAPAFLIGKSSVGDGLYLEDYDPDKFLKFCALLRTTPFISNKGYHSLERGNNSIYPHKWDTLIVDDILSPRFKRWYFAVGIGVEEKNIEGMEAMAVSSVIAFDIEAAHHPDCDGNCRVRHKLQDVKESTP